MIFRLPEQVRQENQNAKSDAIPQPFALEEAACLCEYHRCSDAQREKSHGVFGLHAETDGGADCQPPARIFGGEQLDGEIRRGNPAQIIERNVLHQRASADAERQRSERSEKLRGAAAAELARHQAGEYKSDRFRDRREKTKTGQRSPEEYQRQSAEERRDRRIGDETPIEMSSVLQSRQFVTLESVLVAGDPVGDDGR